MEEAAQVLEIETLIPMLLQNAEVTHSSNGEESSTGCRLKRIVLIGDHFQLPPVVKHMAFQKHAHLDQSLFTRFIRLGVPAVLLNKQGRARPEIASLYSWRYAGLGGSEGLGDLPIVSSDPSYRVGNAGFVNTFQLVDVPEFQGKGEFCPTPHFYQNLGEAEYVVAVYQYMRLLGYPAEKISIITTYNGQKHLIRDVISQRCRGAMFGNPACITTGTEDLSFLLINSELFPKIELYHTRIHCNNFAIFHQEIPPLPLHCVLIYVHLTLLFLL